MMSKKFINISDAHYFGLPSQGNVYSLTQLQMNDGVIKILVASLKRKVFSFEYIDSGGLLKPTVKEVPFTYIPSKAEIISIDAFNKSPQSNDFVIGITIIKGSIGDTRSPLQTGGEKYLNIYSEWEPSTEFNLDSVAQSCMSLELQFIPYQLYHTNLPTSEVVWLLGGSDESIHMYREDKLNHCYQETEISECFPELSTVNSIVLWLDICYTNSRDRRLSAVGFETGEVHLSIINTSTLDVISKFEKCYDGPIISVRFFKFRNLLGAVSNVDPEAIHLLVANGIQPSVIYMNVMKGGLENFYGLADSARFDSVLCSCIADIDMDGQPEILLGTYGQEVLIYKMKDTAWKLCGRLTLANPIFALSYVDVTGDGMRELIALTLKGLHILQHNIEEVITELKQRIEKNKS